SPAEIDANDTTEQKAGLYARRHDALIDDDCRATGAEKPGRSQHDARSDVGGIDEVGTFVFSGRFTAGTDSGLANGGFSISMLDLAHEQWKRILRHEFLLHCCPGPRRESVQVHGQSGFVATHPGGPRRAVKFIYRPPVVFVGRSGLVRVVDGRHRAQWHTGTT